MLFGRPSVLVIDWDAGRRRYIGRVLRAAGCTVTGFADPAEVGRASNGNDCDVLLVSPDLRQEDWQPMVHACCLAGPAPVLVLLEDDGPAAVARVLDAGADDCLVVPFDAADLSARVLRLLRLVWQRRGMAPMNRVAGLQLELARPRVRVHGRDIPLTKLEYRTLWVLAQGEGGVLPFSDIEGRVWGNTGKPHRWALRRVIHNLRRKLGNDPSGDILLVAEPRIGYRLRLTNSSAPT